MPSLPSVMSAYKRGTSGYTSVNINYHLRTGVYKNRYGSEESKMLDDYVDAISCEIRGVPYTNPQKVSVRQTQGSIVLGGLTLYRGTDLNEFSLRFDRQIKVNYTYTAKGFTSVSRNISVAKKFSKGILLIITPGEQTRGFDFNHFDNVKSQGEAEILLDHGLRFKITAIKAFGKPESETLGSRNYFEVSVTIV